MPTVDECQELIDNTTRDYAKFVANTGTAAYLYMNLCGWYYHDKEYWSHKLGCYWASVVSDSSEAYFLTFSYSDSGGTLGPYPRYAAQSVRAVLDNRLPS